MRRIRRRAAWTGRGRVPGGVLRGCAFAGSTSSTAPSRSPARLPWSTAPVCNCTPAGTTLVTVVRNWSAPAASTKDSVSEIRPVTAAPAASTVRITASRSAGSVSGGGDHEHRATGERVAHDASGHGGVEAVRRVELLGERVGAVLGVLQPALQLGPVVAQAGDDAVRQQPGAEGDAHGQGEEDCCDRDCVVTQRDHAVSPCTHTTRLSQLCTAQSTTSPPRLDTIRATITAISAANTSRAITPPETRLR